MWDSLRHEFGQLEFWPANSPSRGWQLGLLGLALVCCVVLSLQIRSLIQQQFAVGEMVRSFAQLNVSGHGENDSVDWLEQISALLPQLSQFENPTSPLSKQRSDNPNVNRTDVMFEVTRKLAERGSLTVAERQAVNQLLGLVLSELVNVQRTLDVNVLRMTHLFYLSVLLLGAALIYISNSSRTRPINNSVHYLMDDALFDNAPIALSIADPQDRILRVNQAFEEATGLAGEELLGTTVRMRDAQQQSMDDEMFAQLAEHGRWQGEYRIRKADGSISSEKVVRVIIGDQGQYRILTMSTDPVIADSGKKLMLWQAHHDNLTKLPNANLLNERINRALVNAKAHQDYKGALISVDIDNFKIVNDAVGYDVADGVITEAAYRFVMCAEEGDTLARVGGDVFAILQEGVVDTHAPERIARKLLSAMQQPFLVDGEELYLSVSIGIVVFPADGQEQGELLQKVDAARGEAKARGGGQFLFFESALNTRAARRMQLETYLRRAIADDELSLNYQPIVRSEDESVYGAEALLRWHSAELGFVSPGEFIPVAENSGLIVDIGRWVIKEVQRQLHLWEDAFEVLPRVSVNVSALQLRSPGDAKSLLELLVGPQSDHISVEITESALASENAGTKLFLAALKAQGIPISLDDFGTGYSSVGYLRDYDFDVLKIDKSFIDSICEVRDHGLVASIIAMGRILGMRIVAEGVEEQDQLDQLRDIGCDFIQGYFFSKPLPPDEFEAFYRAHSGS